MSQKRIRQKKQSLIPSSPGKDIAARLKTPADSIKELSRKQTEAIAEAAKKRTNAIQELIKNHPEEVQKILDRANQKPSATPEAAKPETSTPEIKSTSPTLETKAEKIEEKKEEQKEEQKEEDKSPSKVVDEDGDFETDPIASLRIIAKNLLLVPRLAREFKAISKGFGQFLKNETGEDPAKESLVSRLGGIKDAFTVKAIAFKENVKEKFQNIKKKAKKSIIDFAIDALKTAAILLFTIGIFNKDLIASIIEQNGGVEGIIGAGLESMASSISDFFKSIDFTKTIVEEGAKLIEFLSFGLISKDDAKAGLEKALEFIKPFTDAIGNFFGGIASWLGDKLRGFGRSIDRAAGIETKGTKEERKKELEADPYANAVETLKALDEDIALLKQRKSALREYLEQKKQYDQEKAAGKTTREAPKPPPAITPTKRVSDKSVFAQPTTSAPSGPLQASTRGTPSEVPSSQPVTKADGPLDSLTKKADQNVDTTKFNGEFQRRLELMATAFKQETGKMLLVTSGYRSNEKQKELYDADLAKNNGKPSGKVAQPMPPLGSGAGSVHMKGFGIDLNSKGPDGLNVLAGSRDNPTGWLEKFGLIRNVKGEDWHVTIGGAPSTPDDKTVPDKKGNAVDVATGKVVQGADVGKSSNEIAMEQRQQSKSQNPTVINIPTTTNNTVIQERKVIAA